MLNHDRMVGANESNSARAFHKESLLANCLISSVCRRLQYPDWRDLEPRFPAIAERLLTLDGAKNVLGLELVPYGYFLLDYPAGSNINPRGIGVMLGMCTYTLHHNGKKYTHTQLRIASSLHAHNGPAAQSSNGQWLRHHPDL